MGLSYALYNKLKDLGFPQFVCDKLKSPRGRYITGDDEFNTAKIKRSVYVPTLSELIEACGDREKNYDQPFFLNFVYKDRWDTGYSSQGNDPFTPIEVSGSTPEEAVANLWLAINK